jgi:Truncated, possibly inactive, lysyl-tRNA synthetase (class II)
VKLSEEKLSALRLRARVNAAIRGFFAERGVLEVETPILSAAGNTEPNIDSFTTTFSGHVSAGPRLRWLRTSPEYPLKRLLAPAWAIATSWAGCSATVKPVAATTRSSPCSSGTGWAGITTA